MHGCVYVFREKQSLLTSPALLKASLGKGPECQAKAFWPLLESQERKGPLLPSGLVPGLGTNKGDLVEEI